MKDNARLIKNEPIGQDEVILLREKFINEYAKKRGWNAKELTTNQMLEITTQTGYKTPGMILG
jgi:hypothetical protein